MSCLCLLGLKGMVICHAGEAAVPPAQFHVRPEFKVSETASAPPEERDDFRAIFGARFELPGHDVRALAPAPDGRLYFFCGDGGAAIPRREGGVMHLPEEGAVLRCEPDGSRMEVFCRGLRDVHGLAFDNAGNLFTGDAGSGKDDEGRWLCLVEHGDYGWRTGWLNSGLGPARNPWIAEKLWSTRLDGQAAWILPATANVATGAWGLAHYPGIGFSTRYEDHFFVCNPARRTMFSWLAKPNGAGFLLLDQQEVVSGAAAREPFFVFDSDLYFTMQEQAGEKHAPCFVLSPAVADPQIDGVSRLLRDELKQKGAVELRQLLKHPDQRVRLAAEWRLAVSTDGEYLLREAALSPNGGPEPSVARLHGIWGLGIVARRADEKSPGAGAKMLEPLVPLLEDDDLEVRAQAARVLGELDVDAAFDGLIKALRNPDERVSMFAAEALGKLGRPEALPQLILMMREAGDHDPNLRHAYVDALLGLHDEAAIREAARHDSPVVRLVALLAMRELRRPEIAQFLRDEEPSLVREAACAIHDENVGEALGQLAALIEKPTADEALICRVLNANFRVGQPANAAALARYAGRKDAPETLRIDALNLLAAWQHPPPFDYVTGAPQALPERDSAPLSEAVAAILPALIQDQDAQSPAFKQALAKIILATSKAMPKGLK